MKLISLLFAVFFSLALYGQTYEHITSYHSDIKVEKNCDVYVTETIRVFANMTNIKRGIFREIPLSYDYRGGNVKVGFELLGVKRDGNDEPHHTEMLSNGIRIYAGEENTYLNTGYYTYEISYKVHHVLGFFDDYDEIFWNVNGNGWDFTVDTISANVYYPEGGRHVQHAAYTGGYGSSETAFTSEEIEGGIRFVTTEPMESYEGLSVAVAWNKDVVTYPTFWENLFFFMQWYILWFISGIGLLIGFIYNFIQWKRYGVDPKPGTIIPRFYPPKGFSPAECAHMKRAGLTSKTMFGAELMSLAVKGHVNIEVQKVSGWGGGKSYIITRLNGDEKNLNDTEASFYSRLLGSKDFVAITKGKYNARIESAQKKLFSHIDEKQKGKYYIRNAHLKLKQFLIPFFVVIAGIIGFVAYGGSIGVLIGGVVLMLIMNFIFMRLYEQPTKEGRQIMDEIAGFEMYMKYADKLRIKMNNPPDMKFEHFEENLAYAIALDVAEEWADQFDPVELDDFHHGRVGYYHGAAIGSMSSLGSDLSSAISSAATPPSSSGSGSGGGGFSGGGGGGGGGGGW
jgi:uncharacterized membrane protein YgcG